MKSKRGQIVILYLFLALIAILVLAFISALVLGVFNWASSTATPVLTNLGTVQGTNLSAIGQTTVGTLNTLVGMAPLLAGLAYFILLIGCIALVISYRTTGNMLFIGGFFVFMVIVILIAILVSNAYEGIYTGTNPIALQLQSQSILSFFILNSPYIFAVVGIISGIFLFAGKQNDVYTGGGYG